MHFKPQTATIALFTCLVVKDMGRGQGQVRGQVRAKVRAKVRVISM